MTLAEAVRAIESKKRQRKQAEQEKAAFDYILADLIGRSVARVYSSSNHLPQIEEVYPSLFDSEDIKAEKEAKQMELSAIRFKAFAQSFNNRFKGGEKVE